MNKNLGELFSEARKYGQVYLYTHDSGTYSCRIKFNTIKNVMLEAKSGFDHTTPEAAVNAAIERAIIICGELSTAASNAKQLIHRT